MAGVDGGAGGERRRALRVERDGGTGGAHRVPAPEPLRVPSAVPPAALPSRRDRAALRRPTVLDEAAVVAGDTMAWRSFAALDDPARRALTSPTPLTPALARSLSQHLSAPEPPAEPAREPAAGAALAVPDASAPAQERREPSWTTGPVATRRSRRSTGPLPVPEPDELPPPPPAAQVEAEVRARSAAAARASALPPAPRPVPPVSGPVSVVVPLGDLPVRTPKAAPSATAPLAPADLEALRTAAAASVTAAQAPTATAPTAQAPTTRAAAAPAAATRGRSERGGSTRTSGSVRPSGGSRASGSSRPTGSTRTSAARGSTAARGAWYRRRALGLPAGVLAAAAGLVLAVTLGAGVVGPHKLQEVLTSAGASAAATTAASSDASTTDAAAAVGTAGARAAGSASASATGGGAAAQPEPSGSAGGTSAPAATDPSAAPSAAAPAATATDTPAATAVMPTGDVVYEGFGTAKKTYVEWGTADARDSSVDLGPTWTKAMTGSASWPGWYVGASSLDGEGTVGCRIRDAATGKVLVEQTATGKDIAYCTLGTPAGPS